MKTKTINIYQFNELSEQAKEKAKDDYRNIFNYLGGEESFASLESLVKYFNGEITNFEIDWTNSNLSHINFNMPEMDNETINDKLSQLGEYDKETLKGYGDCKLTGYWIDEELIDACRIEFFKCKRTYCTLELLMNAAFQALLHAVEKDYKYFYSNEQFSEHCESNDYWFTEDGTLTSEE